MPTLLDWSGRLCQIATQVISPSFHAAEPKKNGSALHFFYVAPLRETFFLLTRRADWLCCWAEIF